MYRITNDNFSLKQIADSGQCFRMEYNEELKGYLVKSADKMVLARQIRLNMVEFDCDEEEFKGVWEDYFDLKSDYSKYGDRVHSHGNEYMIESYEYGSGIRILRQEKFECLISFIISQRNRIPRIINLVDKLCNKYGEEKVRYGISYYTFPTSENLRYAKKEDLRSLGFGYRVDYILDAAKICYIGFLNETWTYEYVNVDVQEKALKFIRGVGDKVANCVILFGLHNLHAFPIDVWIQRIIDREFDGEIDIQWCSDFAGLMQQYMFYYERRNK